MQQNIWKTFQLVVLSFLTDFKQAFVLFLYRKLFGIMNSTNLPSKQLRKHGMIKVQIIILKTFLFNICYGTLIFSSKFKRAILLFINEIYPYINKKTSLQKVKLCHLSK